mmetsp:Transcript_23845/g.52823  ORF Transcript_23845/g.52823 Transcript_23845/m.52823 type:complete len:156 (+) Transcript_23845:1961-2428(+)
MAFTEESLDEEERMVRGLARRLGLPLPDIEAIQAQYKAFDLDGHGLDRRCFENMARSLIEGGMCPKDLDLSHMMKTVDFDGTGRMDLEHYVSWYYNNLGPPRLTGQRIRAKKHPEKQVEKPTEKSLQATVTIGKHGNRRESTVRFSLSDGGVKAH